MSVAVAEIFVGNWFVGEAVGESPPTPWVSIFLSIASILLEAVAEI